MRLFKSVSGDKFSADAVLRLIFGVTSAGVPVPLTLADDGTIAPATGGATAAKQDTQIAAEQAIDTAVQSVIPGTVAAPVTPSDITPLTSRALWIGGAGDLVVRLSGAPSTTVTFTAVPAGTLLPISVVRVMAATTATNINTIS